MLSISSAEACSGTSFFITYFLLPGMRGAYIFFFLFSSSYCLKTSESPFTSSASASLFLIISMSVFSFDRGDTTSFLLLGKPSMI